MRDELMKFNIKSIGKKITLLCVFTAVVSLLICSTATIHETSQFGGDMLLDNLNGNMQIMEHVISGKLDRLGDIGSNKAKIIADIGIGDTESLKYQAKLAKNAAGADFAIITDKNGNVIADSNGKSVGSKVCYPIVSRAISGKIIKSFEIIDAESMGKEGLSNLQVGGEKRGLALVYAQPLKDSNGNTVGSILLADVLNNDYNIVDTVSSDNSAATIFLDNLRISTSVVKDGKRAIGTVVSDAVYDIVIKNGVEYVGDADVVGIPMKTLYKPIKDDEGKVIGMIFIGTPKSALINSLNDIKLMTVGIVILAIIISIAISTMVSRTITKPIMELMEVAGEVAKGNYDVSVNIKSEDEIGELAKSFN